MAVYWKYAILVVYWAVKNIRPNTGVYWKYPRKIEYCRYTDMFLNAMKSDRGHQLSNALAQLCMGDNGHNIYFPIFGNIVITLSLIPQASTDKALLKKTVLD